MWTIDRGMHTGWSNHIRTTVMYMVLYMTCTNPHMNHAALYMAVYGCIWLFTDTTSGSTALWGAVSAAWARSQILFSPLENIIHIFIPPGDFLSVTTMDRILLPLSSIQRHRAMISQSSPFRSLIMNCWQRYTNVHSYLSYSLSEFHNLIG